MKLYYFDSRGRAEPIRVFLHYLNVPFEDHRVKSDEWPMLKQKMPQGKLPVLEVEGKKLVQLMAIMRYLGRVHNMTGRNNIERALVDSIADMMTDFSIKISPYIEHRLGYSEGEEHDLRKKTLLPAVDLYFPLFVKYLKEAHSGYYVKSGITYVDFIVAESMDLLHAMNDSIFDKYPEIWEHVKRVHKLHQLKDYIDIRPPANKDIKN